MKDHPVKKVQELIEGFFNLPNPSVSDLEDLVIAINNVIDQVDFHCQLQQQHPSQAHSAEREFTNDHKTHF